MDSRSQANECYERLKAASLRVWNTELSGIPFLKNVESEGVQAVFIVMAGWHLMMSQLMAPGERDEVGPYYSRWFVDCFTRELDEDVAKAVCCVQNGITGVIKLAFEDAESRGLEGEDKSKLIAVGREVAAGSEFLKLALMDLSATDAIKPEIVGWLGQTLLAAAEQAVEGTDYRKAIEA